MGNNNNIIIIIRKRKRKRKEEIIVPSIPRFIEDSCLSQSKSIKRKQTASCPQPPSSLPRQHPTPDRDQPFTFLSLHIYMWIYKWVHVTETHLWYTCSLARFFFLLNNTPCASFPCQQLEICSILWTCLHGIP